MNRAGPGAVVVRLRAPSGHARGRPAWLGPRQAMYKVCETEWSRMCACSPRPASSPVGIGKFLVHSLGTLSFILARVWLVDGRTFTSSSVQFSSVGSVSRSPAPRGRVMLLGRPSRAGPSNRSTTRNLALSFWPSEGYPRELRSSFSHLFMCSF